MDPDVAWYFQRRLFSLPAIVSLLLLVRLWRAGDLYGGSGTLLCCWFVAALVVQLFATGLTAWVSGLIAQTGLAIVLLLKAQFRDV